MIRIAVVEDNPFLAKDLIDKIKRHDEFKFKYHSADGQEFIEMLHHDPILDIVLMDIEMPVMNGIEATALLKSKYPQIKVIMLTVFQDDENLFQAIKAGANGYLLKDEPFSTIEKGIREVLDGGAPMSAVIASKTLKLLRDTEQTFKKTEEYNLTSRETDVLEQLCEGLTYSEIADNLHISPKTVRKHIENIYAKLNAHSKLEAVSIARKNRII